MFRFIVLLALSVSVIAKPHIQPQCRNLVFQVPTKSSNDSGVLIPAQIYHISATYCTPTRYIAKRAQTVQLLVHGGVGNKYYWSALGPVGAGYQEHHYSWVDYARAEGYHTVAIDRLGTGNSSHPDPEQVRLVIQGEITYQLTRQLREPGCAELLYGVPFPKPFKKVIAVGHSLGSTIIYIMLTLHPSAADVALMTSYLNIFTFAGPSAGQQSFSPARDVFPARFGHLDPRYQTASTYQTFRKFFYGPNGTFSPAVAHLHFEREDVQAVGELNGIGSLVGGGVGSGPLVGFKGYAALVLGKEDLVFCGGDCGSGPTSFPAQCASFYPVAAKFSTIVIRDAGHMLNFHYDARSDTYRESHLWLAGIGF